GSASAHPCAADDVDGRFRYQRPGADADARTAGRPRGEDPRGPVPAVLIVLSVRGWRTTASATDQSRVAARWARSESRTSLATSLPPKFAENRSSETYISASPVTYPRRSPSGSAAGVPGVRESQAMCLLARSRHLGDAGPSPSAAAAIQSRWRSATSALKSLRC